MSPSPTASKLLKSYADAFDRALRHVEEGDVRAVHRARVASRRLRELAPVLPIPASVARKLNRRLRRITSRLGRVRELDVLVELIDELHESRDGHSEALARVAVAVAHDRDRVRARRTAGPWVEEMHRIARKLRHLISDLGHRRPQELKATRWAVDARVTRRATRLADALRDAGAVFLPERLHAVRVAVKKLRYSVELAERSGSRSASAAIPVLRRTQDILGRMHDLQVLIERVRQVQTTLTPPNVAVWRALDGLNASLDNDCRRLHGSYMRLRPQLDALVRGFANAALRTPHPAPRTALPSHTAPRTPRVVAV